MVNLEYTDDDVDEGEDNFEEDSFLDTSEELGWEMYNAMDASCVQVYLSEYPIDLVVLRDRILLEEPDLNIFCTDRPDVTTVDSKLRQNFTVFVDRPENVLLTEKDLTFLSSLQHGRILLVVYTKAQANQVENRFRIIKRSDLRPLHHDASTSEDDSDGSYVPNSTSDDDDPDFDESLSGEDDPNLDLGTSSFIEPPEPSGRRRGNYVLRESGQS